MMPRGFNRLVTSLSTLCLRAGALAARFVIAIYLIKVMPLSAVGQFGLVSGAAGLLPAVIGLGLNFYLNREIITLEPAQAGARIRDRLTATLIGLAIAGGLYTSGLVSGAIPGDGVSPWAIPVVALEVLFFDIQMSLVSLRKPALANFLLFLRSALWVAPFVTLSLIYPHLRRMDVLFQMWLVALIVSALVIGFAFRSWPWHEILSAKIDASWLKSKIRAGWLIYLGDLGLAGYSFLDRFVIASMLGLSLTGIYTFFWTMANAVQVLIAAAVIQVALPHLVEAMKSSEGQWRRLMEKLLVKTIVGSLIMAVFIYALAAFALPLVGKAEMEGHLSLLAVILVAVIVRAGAEALQYGLYSRSQDRSFAMVNITGIFCNFALTVLGIKLAGLWGAAGSMLITGVLLFGLRGWLIWRDMQHVARPIAEMRL